MTDDDHLARPIPLDYYRAPDYRDKRGGGFRYALWVFGALVCVGLGFAFGRMV